MNEIMIKCPTCGKVLRLNDAPNINAATFTCPVCHSKHLVGDCQRYEDPAKRPAPASDNTIYGSPRTSAPSGDDTLYAGGSSPKSGDGDTIIGGTLLQTTVGRLVDAKGRIYQLSTGLNTIGRKATTSMATVQIETDDRTMSRSHAIIEVQRTADHQLLHILKNGANKNPSHLNDTLIGVRDQFVLNDGDRLKLGNTLLTFKK